MLKLLQLSLFRTIIFLLWKVFLLWSLNIFSCESEHFSISSMSSFSLLGFPEWQMNWVNMAYRTNYSRLRELPLRGLSHYSRNFFGDSSECPCIPSASLAISNKDGHRQHGRPSPLVVWCLHTRQTATTYTGHSSLCRLIQDHMFCVDCSINDVISRNLGLPFLVNSVWAGLLQKRNLCLLWNPSFSIVTFCRGNTSSTTVSIRCRLFLCFLSRNQKD